MTVIRCKMQEARKKTFLRKNMLIAFCLLLIAICLLPSNSFAQDTIRKPKIGLVLSGGGAKGFAHIGVLKVIEEAGIKIDYIGGTSMGAIIGGLYAAGYNAHQLDSIFKKADYDAVMQDFTPRSSKNFYEKRSDEIYAFTLPFNKFKIGIPTALSKGLYNYNLFNRLTHDVRFVSDFKHLPIPFICIATDAETGDEVVLNNGYLAQALAASGAFPTLYSPVVIDGKYLIDGGVVNNYPIQEIKKLGADIIIGVDVQDELKERDELQDATRILVQISNIQMIKKMELSKKLTDIYIKPDVTEYSVISFDQGEKIIKKGEEAAHKVIDQLKKLGTNYTNTYKTIPKLESDSLTIKYINTPKLKNYTRAYVLGKLRFRNNSKITYSDLKRGIENLNGTQNFKVINYSFEKDNDEEILNLDLEENPIRTFLRFGLHYDDLFKSGILVNLTQKKSLFKNDVISADVVLGDNFRYNFDYYIDNGFYLSFGVKSKYSSFNRNITTDFGEGLIAIPEGIKTLNVDFSDLSNQAYVQTIFIQKFLIGAGVEFKHLKIKSETIGNVVPIIDNSDYLSLFGYLKYDSFDNKFFPKSGWYFYGDYQYYGYSSDFTNNFTRFSIAKADMAYVKTFYKKATVKIQSEGGFAFGDASVPFFNFVLGGFGFTNLNNFRPFYGYDFLSISGNSYVKGALTLDYEIFKKNHLNFTANYSNLGENIFENNDWFKNPSYSGYAFGYGMETFLGPLEIKHSWSPETRDHYTWFSVGFWF